MQQGNVRVFICLPDGRQLGSVAIVLSMLRTQLRRCAALVAAYAVALQAVLSAVAVAAPFASAAGAPFAICGGDSPDNPPGPITHDPCATCLAGHCAGAAASPDRVAFEAPWLLAQTAVEALRRAAILPPVARRAGAHSARAPPLA